MIFTNDWAKAEVDHFGKLSSKMDILIGVMVDLRCKLDVISERVNAADVRRVESEKEARWN